MFVGLKADFVASHPSSSRRLLQVWWQRGGWSQTSDPTALLVCFWLLFHKECVIRTASEVTGCSHPFFWTVAGNDSTSLSKEEIHLDGVQPSVGSI